MPYAGGSAQVFAEFARKTSLEVEVWGLQLPGRGSRLRESPVTDMGEMIALAVDALRPRLELPFALFGHSMGALLAFEVARELRRSGASAPWRLYVSACPAPQAAPEVPPLHGVSDEALLQVLDAFGGLPNGFDARSPAAPALLPALKADLEAHASYVYDPEPPLDCGIVAFAGVEDRSTSADAVARWGSETLATFDLHELPGGHFFVKTHSDLVLKLIEADLAGLGLPR